MSCLPRAPSVLAAAARCARPAVIAPTVVPIGHGNSNNRTNPSMAFLQRPPAPRLPVMCLARRTASQRAFFSQAAPLQKVQTMDKQDSGEATPKTDVTDKAVGKDSAGDIGDIGDIGAIKSDLLQLVEKEITQLEVGGSDANDFLKFTNFKLQDKGNSEYVMTRNISNHQVNISFTLPTIETEEEEVEEVEENAEQEEDAPEEEEFEAVEIEEDEDSINKFFELDVEITNPQNGKLLAKCFVGEDQLLYIEFLKFGDGSQKLDFNFLSPQLQDKIYDYFDGMGLSDQLARYLYSLATQVKYSDNIDSLRQLKGFLE